MLATAKARETHPHIPDYVDYHSYLAQGGYGLLGKVRSGEMPIEKVLEALDHASLRGLGGAGFPTGRKWRSVMGEKGPAPDGRQR